MSNPEPGVTYDRDDPRLRDKLPDGQHPVHVALSPEERAKGFVRPVRRSYRHDSCGAITSMPQPIAETYAASPNYYGRTFCATCGDYFPVGASGEFIWVEADGRDTGERVGT